MSKETIKARSGLQLVVETRGAADAVEVSMKVPAGKRCFLHWGVRHDAKDQWRLPPQTLWPPGSSSAGGKGGENPPPQKKNERGGGVLPTPPPPHKIFCFFFFFSPERWLGEKERREYYTTFS